MYHIKNDQRAIRVSQMLVDALVVLMGQKKFDQIKISDLVKEAGVGRATFYRNFDAMNILIHWIKNGKRHAPDELADGLEGLMKKMVMQEQLL